MLLWFDQPAAYDTATMAHRWTSMPGWNGSGTATAVSTAATPRAGTASVLSHNTSEGVQKTLGSDGGPPVSGTTVILAMRFQVASLVAGRMLIGPSDVGSLQLSVVQNIDGTISVYRGAGATLLGTTTYSIVANTFYHLVLHAVIHPSAGTVDLYIDTVNKLSLTGQNTRATANSAWNGFYAGYYGGAVSSLLYMSDFYVMDGQDGTAATPSQIIAFNTPLGDRKVDWLLAQAGNGSNTGFTLSTGSDHGAVVDDTAPNGDTDYASASTSGLKDTYNLSNLASVNVNIDAVATMIDCSKSDAGAKQIYPLLRSGGTDYRGTGIEVPSTGAYRYLFQVFTKSPANSSISPTPTEVNALQAGAEIV